MADCPCCAAGLNGATGVSDPAAKPEPGDVTICVYCKAVLRIKEDLSFEEMTASEFLGLDAYIQDQLVQAYWTIDRLHITNSFIKRERKI